MGIFGDFGYVIEQPFLRRMHSKYRVKEFCPGSPVFWSNFTGLYRYRVQLFYKALILYSSLENNSQLINFIEQSSLGFMVRVRIGWG